MKANGLGAATPKPFNNPPKQISPILKPDKIEFVPWLNRIRFSNLSFLLNLVRSSSVALQRPIP